MPSIHNRTAVKAVTDPQNPARRSLARVHVGCGALELDYSSKRISHECYLVGRVLEAVFEGGSGVPGRASLEPAGDRGDPNQRRLNLLVKRLEDAKVCAAYEARLKADVGEVGARYLRRILSAGETFSEIAGALASDRKVNQVGDRFRFLLSELAEIRFWRQAIGYA